MLTIGMYSIGPLNLAAEKSCILLKKDMKDVYRPNPAR